MRRLNHPVYRTRLLQAAADALLVALAYYLAFRLRFLDRTDLPHRYWVLFAQSVGFVALIEVTVFAAFGLYQKWWRYVSGRDFLTIGRAVAVASAIVVVLFTVLKPFAHDLPRSVAVMDFLLTLFLVAGARLAVRLIVERPTHGHRLPKHEVLVIGAGSGGQMVVREMHLNPNLGATAIGFVDDDARKQGMRMLGLKVLGTTAQIETILDETEPDEVVIAIPSAPGTLRAKVVAACREREIRVRTLPTVFELLRGGVQLSKQLREVQVEDVLGRDPIVVELDRVGAYLRDRIVLVTGAGGSIGSELCRQIARVGPRLLVMLDHAEDNLFEIEREMVDERHFSQRRVGARRLQGAAPDAGDDAALQAERRLPRRRLQARAADGGQPARGRPQQRDRHPDHRRDRRRLRRRALRPHLHRQGGQPEDGDGRLQGDGRVDRRDRRPQTPRAPASPASASATCSPPRAASCRSSAARSSAAARSPSPTRR